MLNLLLGVMAAVIKPIYFWYDNSYQCRAMVLIRELVQQALMTGVLTIAAETHLRQLLKTRYDQEDLNAFMKLQLAAMSGEVQQESRGLRHNSHVHL